MWFSVDSTGGLGALTKQANKPQEVNSSPPTSAAEISSSAFVSLNTKHQILFTKGERGWPVLRRMSECSCPDGSQHTPLF